ncbi:hypothetical protein QA601_12490 [Chitinispirillales bacterium ANBcel5]|uniref:hypothetical protein n=1 Tax=Cellulosispirillum alkaliphilum TaxID=3039283 RepID=UPI002A4FF6C4|nr:hypothetical protein [Chitinispirillales bacterium ANBcel5]
MKDRSIIACFFLVLIIVSSSFSKDTTQTLTVHFFGASTCRECNTIKREVLEPLQQEHSSSLTIKNHDINEDEKIRKLLNFERQYGIIEGNPISLFVADTFLLGYNNIMQNGEQLILEKLQSPEFQTTIVDSDYDIIGETFRGFSFWLITLAGLADGINPCAIATMIFLISFLATQKLDFKRTLLVGQTYIFAVFLTYFSIGLGAFHALRTFERFHFVSEGIRWSAIALCAFVAVLSLRDAFVFHKTKNIKNIKLQLPDSVKMKIHDVIKKKLTGKNLLISAFITGFIVTLFETMCTAQTYLPILRALPKHESYRIQGYLYLLYYNFLFIVPLQIVMIAAYKGMTWNNLAKGTQKNMVAIKIIIATVMVALATYLFMN